MATARLLLLSNSLLHKFFPKLCGCGLGNVCYQLHLSLKLGKKKIFSNELGKNLEYFNPDDYKYHNLLQCR